MFRSAGAFSARVLELTQETKTLMRIFVHGNQSVVEGNKKLMAVVHLHFVELAATPAAA